MADQPQKRRPPKQNLGQDQDFLTFLQEGTRALQAGRVSMAIDLLRKAHNIDPLHEDTALNLASAYILTKKFKQAVPLLEPLSAQNPFNAMIWTNLAAAYLGNPVLAKDEDQLKAIETFKRALEVNPIAPNVAYNIGLIYIDRKDKTQALYWFNKAVQADPKDKDARSYIKKLEAMDDEREAGETESEI